VTIHQGDSRAAEQALSYVVPSGLGMPVMVSCTANRYRPSGTGLPSATAPAGVARTIAAATAAAVNAIERARRDVPVTRWRTCR
jgi:hypothetical protein